jgi:steroid delta-isomerase-like uncharacterized protein
MSAENEAVVRRFIEEGINARDLGVLDELFSPDYVNHAATSDIPNDLAGYKVRLGYMIEGFPDLGITIEDSFSAGDKVAVRLTVRGTQRGDYMGSPPTGKHATWTAIAVYQLSGGRIVERWENRDDLGLLQQLGIAPPWAR